MEGPRAMFSSLTPFLKGTFPRSPSCRGRYCPFILSVEPTDTLFPLPVLQSRSHQVLGQAPKISRGDAILLPGHGPSSSLPLDSQRIREHADASSHAQSSTSLTLTPDVTYSNASFASLLCGQLTSSHTELSVTSPASRMYLIPACVATQGTALKTITLNWVAIPDFSVFSATVTSLTLSNCYFPPVLPASSPDASTPVADSSADGFTDSGEIDWNELFDVALPGLVSLSFSQVNLRGGLPATLPKRVTKFFLESMPFITGAIPSTLFANGAPTSSTYLLMAATSCNLTGSIPPTLLMPLASAALSSFTLNIGNNLIDGALPEAFFPVGLLTPAGSPSLSIIISDNHLTGPIPPSMFGNISRFNSFAFAAANNLLTGPLPPLFANGLSAASSIGTITLILSSNKIDGSIPPHFLSNGLTASVSYSDVSIQLESNLLTGSIPSDIFSTYRVDGGGAQIPITLKATSMGLYLNDNRLSGSIPPQLLEAIVTDAFGYSEFALTATNNLLVGPLPGFCLASTRITFGLGSNRINGTIPEAWLSCKFITINLSNNPNVTGPLPTGFFNKTQVTSFYANGTSLSGDLPTTRSMIWFDLDYTNIEFCSTASLASAALLSTSFCSLSHTKACACPASYPAACTKFCTLAPSCPGPRPSSLFECINGAWTATSAVETPTLTIPSGTGTVVITNITSTSIVLNGLDSSIEITGCATNLTSLTITLTETQADKLGKSELLKLLLSATSSNCSVDLSSVQLSSTVSGSSCKKLKVKKVTSDDGSTLSGIFTLDTSSCKTWWIILVSVICGVIVLTVLVLILMTIFWPAFRAKVKPYSRARRDPSKVQSSTHVQKT